MKKHLKWARGGAVSALLVAGVLTLGVGSASAYVGQTKDLAFFHGTGSVTLTSGSYAGTAKWNKSDGSLCVYIQEKKVAILGLDGLWNRLTANDCSTSTTSSTNWSRPTTSGYNGMKFRLCQDKPLATDPCGGEVTIYK